MNKAQLEIRVLVSFIFASIHVWVNSLVSLTVSTDKMDSEMQVEKLFAVPVIHSAVQHEEFNFK